MKSGHHNLPWILTTLLKWQQLGNETINVTQPEWESWETCAPQQRVLMERRDNLCLWLHPNLRVWFAAGSHTVHERHLGKWAHLSLIRCCVQREPVPSLCSSMQRLQFADLSPPSITSQKYISGLKTETSTEKWPMCIVFSLKWEPKVTLKTNLDIRTHVTFQIAIIQLHEL